MKALLYKLAFAASAGFVLASLVLPARAQVMCMSLDMAKATMVVRGEQIVSTGQVRNGAAIVVSASGDGSTFTIFILNPNGLACQLAQGTGWDPGFLVTKGVGL